MRLLFITLLVGLVSACATNAQGPTLSEAKVQPPPAGAALVYIYRKYAEPTAWGATVQVNKRDAATLNQGGFTWVYVKPGPAQVKAVWAGLSGQRDSSIELELMAGETYYLELVGVSRIVAANPLMIYTRLGSGVNQIDADRGRVVLAACCALQRAPEGLY